MNLKALGNYRNLFFVLLSGLGFFYLVFLFFFTPKVISAFLMQIIFLIDSLNAHSTEMFSHPSFYIQIIVGSVWSVLLFRFVKSLLSIFTQVVQTIKLVQTLRIIRNQGQYYLIKSSKPEAFTAGFFHPSVYLSQKFVSLSTPDELSSVLYHELSHVKNLDPLRNLIIGFVSNVTPYFPLKGWLFGQYLTLVEINCDYYSQTNYSHPTSLISALLKIQKFYSSPYVSRFSAQSERIKILLGQKTFALRSTIITGFAVMTLLFAVSGSVYKTDIFYQCAHLIRCFENLIVPDHVITQESAKSTHCLSM